MADFFSPMKGLLTEVCREERQRTCEAIKILWRNKLVSGFKSYPKPKFRPMPFRWPASHHDSITQRVVP